MREHLNLNVAQLLSRYQGPLLLIRRTKDEMITTVDASVLSSNRGNDLVITLLQHRYPCVVDELSVPYVREWLAADTVTQASMRLTYEVNDDVITRLIQRHNTPSTTITTTYPSLIGEGLSEQQKIQLALFLVSKYLEDYDSTHCSPLPAIYFHEPWTEPKH